MRHIDIPEVKEKVDWKALNKLDLASVLFAKTEIPELANYPKRSTKPF